jgi:transcriptional regulator with PAS, ATPase and Fis domain
MGQAKIIITGSDSTREVELHPRGLVLGRAETCDVILNEDSVSRRHARISQDPFGRWILEDLGSQNGILINGQLIQAQAMLPQQKIEIGTLSLELVLAEEETPSSCVVAMVDMEDESVVSYGDDKAAKLSPVLVQHLNELSVSLMQLARPADLYAQACQCLAGLLNSLVAVVRLPCSPAPLPKSPDILACSFGQDTAIQPLLQASSIHLSRRTLDAVRSTDAPVMANSGGAAEGEQNMHLTIVDDQKPHVVFAVSVNVDEPTQMVEVLYVDMIESQTSEAMLDFIEVVARHINFAQKHLLFAELEKSEAYLHQILNQLQVGTLFVNENGVVEYHTKKCQPLLDSAAHAESPLHWTDFLRVEAPMQQVIAETLRLPEGERRRLLLAPPQQGEKHWFELEIKDDAADPHKRIMYLYEADEIVKLREQVQSERYGAIIGKSKPVREMVAMLERVASGDWSVVIEGETGVGKELAARHVHDASHRKNGPFVAVNCARLNDSLLTSQLFGHKKGSFTGAVSDQRGFFEAANGGTLFLDEIGDISLPLQASLLRVLQEKEILRVGDTQPKKVDARVVVATNRDLQQETDAGRFRQDLLYRIRVARVRVPPLRERREDISLLAKYFFDKNAGDNPDARIRSINLAVFPHLVAYEWPGNIRELKGAIDYAWIHCSSDQIQPEDLPHELLQPPGTTFELEAPISETRTKILQALEKTGGNRKAAAGLLNISRATLYRHLKRYGLDT